MLVKFRIWSRERWHKSEVNAMTERDEICTWALKYGKIEHIYDGDAARVYVISLSDGDAVMLEMRYPAYKCHLF